MLGKLTSVIEELDSQIKNANEAREVDDLGRLPRLELKILGQMSLFLNPEVCSKISLFATQDLDAYISGDWTTRAILKVILSKHGLLFDDLSSEIWMPKGTKYDLFYESEAVLCEVAQPVFTITSKAIKAPDKNRALVIDGIALFGDELISLITANGGEIEMFISQK